MSLLKVSFECLFWMSLLNVSFEGLFWRSLYIKEGLFWSLKPAILFCWVIFQHVGLFWNSLFLSVFELYVSFGALFSNMQVFLEHVGLWHQLSCKFEECCSVLQCVTVCCSVLQPLHLFTPCLLLYVSCHQRFKCVAVCVAVHCSVL